MFPFCLNENKDLQSSMTVTSENATEENKQIEAKPSKTSEKILRIIVRAKVRRMMRTYAQHLEKMKMISIAIPAVSAQAKNAQKVKGRLRVLILLPKSTTKSLQQQMCWSDCC